MSVVPNVVCGTAFAATMLMGYQAWTYEPSETAPVSVAPDPAHFNLEGEPDDKPLTTLVKGIGRLVAAQTELPGMDYRRSVYAELAFDFAVVTSLEGLYIYRRRQNRRDQTTGVASEEPTNEWHTGEVSEEQKNEWNRGPNPQGVDSTRIDSLGVDWYRYKDKK